MLLVFVVSQPSDFVFFQISGRVIYGFVTLGFVTF